MAIFNSYVSLPEGMWFAPILSLFLVKSATSPSRHHRPCQQRNASNPCAWRWEKSEGTLGETMGSRQNRASNSENHIESEKIHQKSLKLGALRADNLQNHHVPFKTRSSPKGIWVFLKIGGIWFHLFQDRLKGSSIFKRSHPYRLNPLSTH